MLEITLILPNFGLEYFPDLKFKIYPEFDCAVYVKSKHHLKTKTMY